MHVVVEDEPWGEHVTLPATYAVPAGIASVIWTLMDELFWLLIQTIRHSMFGGVEPLSVFVPTGGLRVGVALTGVVSPPVLLPGVGSVPFVPSSAIVAMLAICVTPAGSGLVTVTANVAVWLPPPAARLPTASVQGDPALLLGEHDQPAVLAPALNVVFAGTVSVSVTPEAPRLPVLE